MFRSCIAVKRSIHHLSKSSFTKWRSPTTKTISTLTKYKYIKTPIGLTHCVKRCSTSISIEKRKSIDILPGDYEMNQEETKLLATQDSVELFEQKYNIAKQFDPHSPMIKMNAFGVPAIILFSHDLVKQWQQYELQGQTRRPNIPIFEKLVGSNFADLYGAKHLEWRKKTAKSFKPHIIDQYTPFIQKSAGDIVLKGISNTSQESGEFVYFCQEAKRFAFEIGIKFVMGPLINTEERAHLFSVCNSYTKSSISLYTFFYEHFL